MTTLCMQSEAERLITPANLILSQLKQLEEGPAEYRKILPDTYERLKSELEVYINAVRFRSAMLELRAANEAKRQAAYDKRCADMRDMRDRLREHAELAEFAAVMEMLFNPLGVAVSVIDLPISGQSPSQ